MIIKSGNNGLGINAYSGPMGQKDPAYGEIEKQKVLTKLAPIGSPAALGAPKRAQRRATRSGGRPMPQIAQQPEPAPPTVHPDQHNYNADLRNFWQEVASNPEASPQVKAYAAQVT